MTQIGYEVKDGIGTITIDRAEKRNAMTYAMLRDFTKAVQWAADDSEVRAVIVTGVRGSFCAGTDISDLADTPEGERSSRNPKEMGEGGASWWPLFACQKPVIAAIDGPAVGMGAELTSQCDIRLATPRARFAWNFVHRGLVPDTGAGTWLLPRLLGLQTAARLLYSGEFISAEEAAAIGYVCEVVESDALIPRARTEAARFTKGSPFAIERAKRLLNRGFSRSLEEHLVSHQDAMQECFDSDDHREGVASFLEKREPKFVGR